MATKAEMNQLKARLAAAELAAARWHATAEELAGSIFHGDYRIESGTVQTAVKEAYAETAWVVESERKSIGAFGRGKRYARRERIEEASAKREERERKAAYKKDQKAFANY